jgi:transposase
VILPGGRFQVFVATRPVDFRKGMDGLAAVVQGQLRLDPFCGAVFVFRAKRADRVKLLVWDGRGPTLIYKRLDAGTFCWPRIEGGVMRLSPGQLGALFEGLDWKRVPVWGCGDPTPRGARRVPRPARRLVGEGAPTPSCRRAAQ